MATKAKKIEPVPAEERGADHVPSFVLTKNHGLHVNGKANVFYGAGTTFDGVKDKDLIHRLIQNGASLEESALPQKKTAPQGNDTKPNPEGEQDQQQGDGQQKNDSE